MTDTSGRPLRAAVLGATGAVGQRFVQRLDRHPWFEVTRLAASPQSAGRPYHEACRWYLAEEMPDSAASQTVSDMEPDSEIDVAFSALTADVAASVEPAWAAAGVPVFSNARSFRMEPDVPLLVPEVNADHLDLVTCQRTTRGWPSGGAIVTNANCSTTFLAMALAPLHAAFGVERVVAVTLQAVSGAGYPGVPSLDILGNVIPFISGEEEKLETETCKILGRYGDGAIAPAEIAISAQVNRVPVLDGHLIRVSAAFRNTPRLEELEAALAEFGADAVRALPSAPDHPILVRPEIDRPQPRLDADRGDGMVTSVGQIRPCPVLDARFTILGHNTVRGAAGGAILNAELARARGVLGPDA